MASSPLIELVSLLRAERRQLVVVVVYAVAVGLLSLAVPIAASALVNSVALSSLVQQLIALCVALAVALTLAAGLQILQQVLVEYVQRRVFVRVANDLAERLPRVVLSAWDRTHGPELLNRFFDVLTVQKAAATLLMDGVALALQMLIGLVLLGFYDPILLGFDAVLIVGMVLIIWPLGIGGVRTSIRESAAKYEVAGWLEEIARHPVAFKFSGGPTLARARTEELVRAYLATRADHFRVLLRQIGFGLVLQVLASVALLGIGGYLVMAGHLTLGQLVAAQIIVNLVVSTFSKFGKQLDNWYDLLAGADKVGQLLHLPTEAAPTGSTPVRSGAASFAMHGVSFQYDGSPRSAVVNFQLEVAAGERVALVGANGSGKTTLVELLLGLRRPSQGWVAFDGIDLRDLDPAILRPQIAIVQDLEIFAGTIAENISMGRAVTDEAVREALAAVLLLDDVRALPEGIHTPLTTGGSPLSLGQAERLMIARAIAGRPRLLVLDETLDAVHRIVRLQVVPALLAPDAPWTVIVVTHSEEVAKLCGRQIVVEKPA